jgi:hypothetical protein
MSDALEILDEIRSGPGTLRTLHPLKLDRWHRALLGLPETLYMQHGCQALLEQLETALTALRAVVDLVGTEGLPAAPQELSRRAVQKFRWYAPVKAAGGVAEFQAEWDKASAAWKLTFPGFGKDVIKTVPNLEAALEKALEWAAEFDESASAEE